MVRARALFFCCALLAADRALAEGDVIKSDDALASFETAAPLAPLTYRALLDEAMPEPEPEPEPVEEMASDEPPPPDTPIGLAPLTRLRNADWHGEASLSANAKTGNTESTDFGAAFKIKRESRHWTSAASLVYDYGQSAGEETKNRLFTDYQLDYIFNDRAFVFARGNYKLDEFDGYEYRANLGGGIGYDLVDRNNADWSLQVGPAAQIDAGEAVIDDDTGEITAPAETDTDLAVGFGSRMSGSINDKVQLSNDTDITWEEETTIYFNSAGLTAQLLPSLATRFSLDVTHDTDPISDKLQTDTTTRASIIYSFGS